MSTEESSEMRTPLMEGGQGLAKTYGSGATVTWVQPSSTAVAKNSGMCCRSLLSTFQDLPRVCGARIHYLDGSSGGRL